MRNILHYKKHFSLIEKIPFFGKYSLSMRSIIYSHSLEKISLFEKKLLFQWRNIPLWRFETCFCFSWRKFHHLKKIFSINEKHSSLLDILFLFMNKISVIEKKLLFQLWNIFSFETYFYHSWRKFIFLEKYSLSMRSIPRHFSFSLGKSTS
jgi:hypothetical protein